MLSGWAKIHPRQEYSKALDSSGEVLLTGRSRTWHLRNGIFFSLPHEKHWTAPSSSAEDSGETWENDTDKKWETQTGLLSCRRGAKQKDTPKYFRLLELLVGVLPQYLPIWRGQEEVKFWATGQELLLPTQPSQPVSKPLMKLANWHMKPLWLTAVKLTQPSISSGRQLKWKTFQIPWKVHNYSSWKRTVPHPPGCCLCHVPATLSGHGAQPRPRRRCWSQPAPGSNGLFLCPSCPRAWGLFTQVPDGT